MAYLDRITIEPGRRSGKPCVRGLRMTVADVLEYLASGMSEDELLRDFPDLTREDVRACLGFAADRERRLAVLGETGSGMAAESRSLVHSDPGISGGTPVFCGTRVPAQTLFDYLEGGETLDEFLDQFPSVSREQAVATLGLARDFILARARSV